MAQGNAQQRKDRLLANIFPLEDGPLFSEPLRDGKDRPVRSGLALCESQGEQRVLSV